MGYGKTSQIGHAGSQGRKAGGFTAVAKRFKHRSERRRAARDPECPPQYRRYAGYMG